MTQCSILRSFGPGGASGGMGDEGRPREMYAPKEREVEDLWGNQVKTGINFSKYDSIPVKVLGENKPPAIVNFQNSGLATVLLENILRAQQSLTFRFRNFSVSKLFDFF